MVLMIAWGEGGGVVLFWKGSSVQSSVPYLLE